jgi:hypothetical protein
MLIARSAGLAKRTEYPAVPGRVSVPWLNDVGMRLQQNRDPSSTLRETAALALGSGAVPLPAGDEPAMAALARALDVVQLRFDRYNRQNNEGGRDWSAVRQLWLDAVHEQCRAVPTGTGRDSASAVARLVVDEPELVECLVWFLREALPAAHVQGATGAAHANCLEQLLRHPANPAARYRQLRRPNCQ